MGRDLEEAQRRNEIVKVALSQAQDEAMYYESRMRHLNYELEQRPDQIHSVKAMIEAKNKMFTDLEAKAGESWMASIQLEKSSRRAHERAEMEVGQLKKQLAWSVALIDKLTDSKVIFQQQSTDVLRMLRSRIQPTDFVDALDHHFSLVVQDNSFLQWVISEQTRELSDKDTETAILKARVLEMNDLLEEHERLRTCLETKVREQEDQVGALELEMDAMSSQNEQDDARNSQINADMEKHLRAAYQHADETRDERERELIRSKDSEIFSLRETCKAYSTTNRDLEVQLQNREAAVHESRAEICHTHVRLTELSAELAAAREDAAALESQARARLGLPPTLSILDVLGQKQDLDSARRLCRDLEQEVQDAKIDAERSRVESDRVKDQSECCSFGMQSVGMEILARLRRARGAGGHPRLMETDEELEWKLREFWKSFD